jgi:hypothetical protein
VITPFLELSEVYDYGLTNLVQPPPPSPKGWAGFGWARSHEPTYDLCILFLPDYPREENALALVGPWTEITQIKLRLYALLHSEFSRRSLLEAGST